VKANYNRKKTLLFPSVNVNLSRFLEESNSVPSSNVPV